MSLIISTVLVWIISKIIDFLPIILGLLLIIFIGSII